MTHRFKPIHAIALPALLSVTMLTGAGCASSGLNQSRRDYYSQDFESAANQLSEKPGPRRNEVLVRMERGMVWQTAGQHDLALRDWLDAQDLIRELDYIRLSEKTTSLLINDSTQTYTGWPYERALMHVFTAKSFFAKSDWRSAAVEARVLAYGLEDLNGFPDDPYTRYVAALAFEMIRDFNGSRIEFTKADELLPDFRIDPQTGAITPGTNAPPQQTAPQQELILLVGIGRAPAFNMGPPGINARWGANPYVEIRRGNQVLGRSYSFNTTTALSHATQQRIATLQTAKTVTRIIAKEAISQAVEEQNLLLGGVLRILLFAVESPDTRSWQTLPNWLQVARIPLPDDRDKIEILLKSSRGPVIKRIPLPDDIPNADGKHILTIRAW